VVRIVNLDPWSWETLLLCFASGIIGASIGALFSFIMVGALGFAGCLLVLLGGNDFLLTQVAFGPLFSPWTGGFNAGVFAGTYAAAVRKNHPGGSAKDITTPLINTSGDVLLMGGLGALIGHILFQLFTIIPIINKFDCGALSIATVAFLARGVFQKQAPWGDMESIKKYGYLGTGDHTISWVPWLAPWDRGIVYGFGCGLLSGGLTWMTKMILDPMVVKGLVSETSAYLASLTFAFCIAILMLTGLNLATGDVQKFPVGHQNCILASLAYLYFGDILVAGIVGVLAAFLVQLMARMFWNHGSNHVDPPACTIAVGTFLLWLASQAF